MSDDHLDRQEDMMADAFAGAIAGVIRNYQWYGHMPEYCVDFTMQVLDTAIRRAFAQTKMHEEFTKDVRLQWHHSS